MIAAADREELNYLFGDSLSDADLLRAVECIESAQTSVDQAPPTGATSNVTHNTSRAESTGNAGGLETAAQLQFGKFYTLCTFTIHILASLLISADRRRMMPVGTDIIRGVCVCVYIHRLEATLRPNYLICGTKWRRHRVTHGSDGPAGRVGSLFRPDFGRPGRVGLGRIR